MPLDFQRRDEMSREIQKHGFSLTRALAPSAGIDRITKGTQTLEDDVCGELSRQAQSEGRAIRGIVLPFEAFTRDLTTTATSGGELVGTDLKGDQAVDLLRATSITASLGATLFTGQTKNFTIPRITVGASGEWIAENGAPSESTHTTDDISFSPKHIAAYTEIGRTLMIQGQPAVDALVARDLSSALGTSLDVAAINGSGTSNEPTGILNQAIGSVALGTNGAIPDFDSTIDLKKEVSVDNALRGSLAYLTESKAIAKLQKTAKVSSTDSVMILEGNSLNGYPIAESNNVPSNLTKGSGSALSAMIFGAWQDLLIAQWGPGIDVLVNPYADSTSGKIRISVFMDCDIHVRHAESFAAIQDLITA
jgi:HK97 family phage major capsid protein